ncbi:MAG: hypothetical protein ACR2GD_01830 [Pyrinomonadaceae bacterium]
MKFRTLKIWKKILLALLAIILLAQIPFIYNRYKIGQLADKINQFGAQRIVVENPNFRDYKGIIHAHTSLGGHSTGSFTELINAAQSDQLDFVVMTEHTDELYDTSALTLRGNYKGVLFINGQEVDTATDRFLLLNGDAESNQMNKVSTPDFLEKYHALGKVVFITYPEKFKTWDSNFDGVEVFSLHTNAAKMNPLLFAEDALWSYHGYPQLVLAKYLRRPDDNLKKFDEIAANRKITLFAGSDAQSNIGFHIFGDDAQHKIINLKFDSYATIFNVIRNHVLLEKDKPLTQENLLAALKNGHSFIGVDAWGESDGFNFTAGEKLMGDEISLGSNLDLKAVAPHQARFVLYKNGEKVFEAADTTEMNFQPKEPGAYRVEVYLDSLGFSQMPWIISNPIYVRTVTD